MLEACLGRRLISHRLCLVVVEAFPFLSSLAVLVLNVVGVDDVTLILSSDVVVLVVELLSSVLAPMLVIVAVAVALFVALPLANPVWVDQHSASALSTSST